METITLPKEVLFILNQLNNSGFEAFVVGGCVRDSLMGRTPHDWDICTSALPTQIIHVFKNYQVIPTGLKHGTVTVVLDKKQYEITTYRIDGKYEDNRHPKNVTFTSDLYEDLSRRDFTINAIAYNPNIGIVDIFDGVRDIKKKIIRCVGKADDRFCEDALRILRAIRFSISLSFNLHNELLRSISRNKYRLVNISAERINTELTKTLQSNAMVSNKQVSTLFSCLLEVLPILKRCNINTVVKNMVNNYNKNVYIKLLLLFDLKEKDLLNVLKDLRYDNKTINNVVKIYNYGNIIVNSRIDMGKSIYYARKLLNQIEYDLAKLAIEYARIKMKSEFNSLEVFAENVDKEYQSQSCYNLSRLKINGNDLKKIGYQGKNIGICLNYLLDGVMMDNIGNDYTELIKEAYDIKEMWAC